MGQRCYVRDERPKSKLTPLVDFLRPRAARFQCHKVPLITLFPPSPVSFTDEAPRVYVRPQSAAASAKAHSPRQGHHTVDPSAFRPRHRGRE